MASEVGNLFILGRYLWIMLSFISLGFQSVLFSLKRLFGIVGAQEFLCEVDITSAVSGVLRHTLMPVQNNKGFQFVRRKNEMSLIGRLDISVIFTKTELRVLRIGKSTTWSQRYRILTALCFDSRRRSTICRNKFKPFERTFISLLLSFYNSALMQRKKEKEKSISHEVKDESENQQQTQQPLRFEARLF